MKKLWVWIAGIVAVVILAFYVLSGSNTAPVATVATNNSSSGNTSLVDTTGQGSPSSSNSGGQSAGGTGSGSNTQSGAGTSGAGNSGTSGGGGDSGGDSTTATGAYKNGTYTGPVTNAIYGNIQVKVTISGGKIMDVTCPVYPDSGGHTSEVNGYALPQLKQETIAAQSANIDIVSGATQTSEAFQQSLAAALAQAKS